MLIRSPRPLVLALAVALLALPAAADAATVSSDGTTITYAADAGHDDAVRVTAGPTIEARPEGTATLTAGSNCAGGPTVVTCTGSRIAATLGDGNDIFDASTVAFPAAVDGGIGADLLTGGTGADSLTGGPGVDVLAGVSGADQLFALDGTPDRLTCGGGGGSAEFDPGDAMAGCLGVANSSLTDADGDGAPPGQDCDDANSTRYVGAPDFFSNGIDEDCDGADDINLDVDGDGYKRPDDCNDRNPNIKPNAVEKRGNRVDENCDKRLQDFFPMDVLVTNSWAYSATQTRVNRLIVRGAPKRARITVRCLGKGRGCPFKRKRRRVKADNRGEDITRFFRGARLRPGAKLRIDVKAANFISVRLTFTVRPLDIPALKRTCREGKRRAKAC
jgi:Putative metal-binding motif/RTX calcium-binding nonapeptide repeat (4 copies)